MSQSLAYGYEAQDPYSLYYRHSNRITWPGIILGAAIGIGIGCVCSIVYAYGVRWVPYPKLDMLLAVVFGAAVGGSTAKVMHVLKVRSVPITLAVIAAVMAVAYYLAWAIWLAIVFGESRMAHPPSAAEFITHPNWVYHGAGYWNRYGTWRMSEHDKEATKGIGLTLIWVAEAIVIFGGALLVGQSIMGDTPFCEGCNEWASSGLSLTTGLAPDPAQLKQRLESGDFAYIRTLPPPNTASGSWLTFTHRGCLDCQKFHTLTVKQTTAKFNKKGQIAQKTEKTLVRNLLVGPEALEVLKSPIPQQA
jgi:hypothetical protein